MILWPRILSHIATLMVALLAVVHPQPLAVAVDRGPILLVTSQETLPYKEVTTGFRQSLASLNGTIGSIEEHSLQGNINKASEVFKGVKERRVQLILTVGSFATQAALREAPDIPIVASMIPNAADLKQNPNATGVVLDFPLETQLQWLQKIAPQIKTIGVLFNPGENQVKIAAATKVAHTLGLSLLTQEVETPQALPDALENLAKQAEILWGISDQTVLSPQTAEPILLFSFRHRIPFTGLSTSWAKAGALYALDRDYKDVGMQCGEIAAKILRGTPVSALPPSSPRKVFYALNLKTAEHMKMTIPQSLIDGAQQVFR